MDGARMNRQGGRRRYLCLVPPPSSALVHAFRIGRGDQPKLAVEDVQHLVKISGPGCVSGGRLQLLFGPHLALDVGAGFGQQGFEHGLRRFLVHAMAGIGLWRDECLFEERDAHARRAADFAQGGRRPRFAFHHLGEKCQPHRDDFPFLRQLGDRLVQELRAGPW